ncbi:uncharacterized protein METZ01_LOCUS471922, partial [marine metagenome]
VFIIKYYKWIKKTTLIALGPVVFDGRSLEAAKH